MPITVLLMMLGYQEPCSIRFRRKTRTKSLVVLAFDSKTGASDARDKLYELQKEELIALEDAAVVIWKENGKTKVKQSHSLVGTGALGGKYKDVGVDDQFIKEVGDTVEPGRSALFLLVTRVQVERVVEELSAFDPTVLQTNLSTEDEEKLRDTFAAEEVAT